MRRKAKICDSHLRVMKESSWPGNSLACPTVLGLLILLGSLLGHFESHFAHLLNWSPDSKVIGSMK